MRINSWPYTNDHTYIVHKSDAVHICTFRSVQYTNRFTASLSFICWYDTQKMYIDSVFCYFSSHFSNYVFYTNSYMLIMKLNAILINSGKLYCICFHFVSEQNIKWHICMYIICISMYSRNKMLNVRYI